MFKGMKQTVLWSHLKRRYVNARYHKYFGKPDSSATDSLVLGMNNNILSVKNLQMQFKAPNGGVKSALSDVSFDVKAQDFFGIIGESGSGKTTVGRCIMRMYSPTSGSIVIGDKLFSNPKLSTQDQVWFHKNVQMIFQDPSTSVNPIKSIYAIVSEPLIVNKIARQQTVGLIRLINRVKWYFQYSYHKFVSDVLLSDQIKYYQSLLDASKRLNSRLANFDFERFHDFGSFSDYVIDRLHLYNNRATNAMVHIEHFTHSQQQFFEQCDQKINDLALEEYDLKLEQLHLSQKRLTQEYDNSCPRYLAKKRLVQLQKALLDRQTEVDHYYGRVIGDVKRSYLTRIGAVYNTKKQASILEVDSFVQHKIYALEEHFHKLLQHTLSHFFQPKYLNELEIEQIFRFVSSRFIDLFDAAFVQLETWHHQFCATGDLAQKKAIIKSVRNFSFIAQNALNTKTSAQSLLTKVFASDVELLGLMRTKLERIITLSNRRAQAFATEFNQYRAAITTAKKELGKFSRVSLAQLKLRRSYVKELKAIKRAIQDTSIVRDNVVYRLSHSELGLLANVNAQKQQLKVLKYETKNLDKINNYLLRNVVRTQSRFLAQKTGMGFWERQRFFKTNQTMAKNLQEAWKTRKSIAHQFKLIMRRIGMFSFIFKHSRFISWCFYFLVRKAILLDRVYQALDEVGLKHEFAHRYPHEFSGGQLQRIVIARALITNPKIIIADEAISSLDVSVQSRVIKMMQELCAKKQITFLFIAHDLSMVHSICNRMIIMHNGRIVEQGDTAKIFANPSHIYTQSLMKAIPELGAIDKDLANVNEQDLLYANEYNSTNLPSLHCINNDPDHQVFATPSQIACWNQ